MVFAALHIVPAAGEPWPWEMALEAEVASETGGAVGVAVAAGLKVMQALLFGIAMAGLPGLALSDALLGGE